MLKGLNAAYAVIFPAYATISVVAYAAFGTNVSSFLLDNLQNHISDGFLVFIYIVVTLNGLALGAVYIQACFSLLVDLIPCLGHHHDDGRFYGGAQLLARFLYVGFCTFFATAMPFFGSIAALSGAICFTPLTVSKPGSLRNAVVCVMLRELVLWNSFIAMCSFSRACRVSVPQFVYPFIFWSRSELSANASRWKIWSIWSLAGLFGMLGFGGAIGSLYFIVEESGTYEFFQ